MSSLLCRDDCLYNWGAEGCGSPAIELLISQMIAVKIKFDNNADRVCPLYVNDKNPFIPEDDE